MNTRWMILTVLAVSQLTWAQDRLDFRVFVHSLNEENQRKLVSLKNSNEKWEQVVVDQQSESNKNVHEIDFDSFMESVSNTPSRDLPGGGMYVMLDKDEWHESMMIRHKPIHALEYIPESEPKRYVLREITPEPEVSIRIKWDETATENEVLFNLEITRSSIIGREQVEGSTLNVGKPIHKHYNVAIEGTTTTFQTTKAYLWDVPDSPPLLIRIQAWDRKLPSTDAQEKPTRPQYTLESHTLVVHGPIEKGKSLDSEPPIGFTLISGNAIAFRFDLGENIHRKGESSTEALWDDVLEMFETFGVKATPQQLQTASAPRVTNFIADPNINDENNTLLLMVVANHESRGYSWKQEVTNVEQLDRKIPSDSERISNGGDETAPSTFSLTALIGRYHSFFSQQNQPISETMLKQKQWAIIADFVVHAYSVGNGQNKEFVTANLGMAFVSRVTEAEQERHYKIDFFHLNRQTDNLPKSVEDTPEAIQAFNDSFRDSHFRYQYQARDGETVGFFYSASPTEHYIILNTMTVIDGNGVRYFRSEL